QILTYDPASRSGGIDTAYLGGLVIDNSEAILAGPWEFSQSTRPHVGNNYAHDGNKAKGMCSAIYKFKLDQPGRYQVKLLWPGYENRASNVPIYIVADGSKLTLDLDQKKITGQNGSIIATVEAKKSLQVEVSNAGTEGFVIADAVQLMKLD
ncbi:MAG: FAD-dependent oxidoreductase, partial [Planctomycetota bacterium]